ncbi:porin [Desulfuromonas acetexigens]|uniref:Porin n=1 Tax=Trichloromonas acetexigens TaxID=38815 RepID=A0A550JB54_9BACT|nr:selenite/tellurite reduction operon porin ExtI [Desulfuromonas acetexigens]TRO80500.1 porin [Desulfuromonas acetexigens]
MEFRKLLTACVGTVLLATPAFAGPTWTFGPEDQGALKLEYKGQFQLNHRDTGGGSDDDESVSEFNFRRNRVALMGAYGKHFGLYVQTEFNEDNNITGFNVTDGDNEDFQLLDAVMRFKYNDAVNFWLGKYKYSFTRENLEACEMPLTLDRSLLIRAPLVDEGTRDKGVTLWGNLFDQKFQYRLDAMNGRNDSASAPDSAFRYGARAHVTLLDPENGHGYKGTYLGEKKVLTIGGAYQMEKDVAYSNYTAAGIGSESVDYKAWTADLFFEYPVDGVGTFTVSGAYADYDLDDAYKNDNLADLYDTGIMGINGEKNGGYVKIGYMLPNLPLQFFARSESWSLSNYNGFYDQEVDWYGGGFNYYFRGQDLKLTMELSQADFDKEGKKVFGGKTYNTEDFTTVTAQLQVIF